MLSLILALASAAAIALSSLFVGALSGRMGVMQLARWQMTATLALTGGLSLALGGWRSLDGSSLWLLLGSGLTGIVLGSPLYYAAIFLAGARLTALVFTLSSPFALLLGWLVLGETVAPLQGAGVLLILAGIALAVTVPDDAAPEPDAVPAPPRPALGIALGAVTALLQATGSLLARPAMAAGVEPFTAMAIRAGLAAAVFALVMVLPAGRRDTRPVTRHTVGLALGSTVFGMVLGMSLLMAALAGGEVGIVATLSAMTPILILPMIWAATGRPPPARGWAGAALAVAGTALIALGASDIS